MITYEEEIKNKGRIELVRDLINHGGIPIEKIIEAANLPEPIIKIILEEIKTTKVKKLTGVKVYE